MCPMRVLCLVLLLLFSACYYVTSSYRDYLVFRSCSCYLDCLPHPPQKRSVSQYCGATTAGMRVLAEPVFPFFL